MPESDPFSSSIRVFSTSSNKESIFVVESVDITNVKLLSDEESINLTTGALIIDGGLSTSDSTKGQMNIESSNNVTNLDNNAGIYNDASLVVNGGVSVGKNIFIKY